MESRYYPNTYQSNASLDSLKASIPQFIELAIPYLEENISSPLQDVNFYAGKVGVAMTLSRIYKYFHLYEESLPSFRMTENLGRKIRHIGFCSDHISFYLYHALLKKSPFDLESTYYNSVDSQPDELLYGRAGLALLLSYFQKKGVILARPGIVQEVLQTIDVEQYPWTWHGKVYYGGAHGTSGILLALKRLQVFSSDSFLQDLVYYASLPSGNFKSSAGSSRDELVQWCHGATGFVPLLLAYAKDQNIPSTTSTDYEQRAVAALNVIWERGLLHKGCGVCHGVAGNGYAFLSMYLHCGQAEYLTRALHFASFIVAQGAQNCCAKANFPASLFEGLAGTVHFLLDILHIITTNHYPTVQHMELFDGIGIF